MDNHSECSALQTLTSSFFLSSFVEECVNALLNRVVATDDLCAWDGGIRSVGIGLYELVLCMWMLIYF